LKRRLNARIEYAKFLQDTVKEMAKEVKNSQSGETRKTAEDLDKFLNRVRSLVSLSSLVFLLSFFCLTCMSFIFIQVRTGALVSNDEILGFAKLFNDELTLDNISRLPS
jgi:LETM1 and EF-hand domain-containing protein 1